MRGDGHPPRTGRADDLRAAREALYRPDADVAAVARFEALRSAAEAPAAHEASAWRTVDRSEEVEGPREGLPAPRSVDRPGKRSSGRCRGLVWPAAALAVGAVGGVLLGAEARAPSPSPSAAPVPAQLQVVRHVVDSGGSLTAQDYFRLYPDDLPIQWGGASTGVAFRRLVGDEHLPVSPSRASEDLLIVAGCPRDDGRYRWVLRDEDADEPIATGAGTCGALEGDGVRLPAASRGAALRLDSDVDGTAAYSITVLER